MTVSVSYTGLDRAIAASTGIEKVELYEHGLEALVVTLYRDDEQLEQTRFTMSEMMRDPEPSLTIVRRVEEMFERTYLPLVEPFEDYLWSA